MKKIRRFMAVFPGLMVAVVMMALTVLVLTSGCTRRNPVEAFAHRQEKKVRSKTMYFQADYGFWAGMYEPTREDLNDLRLAWNEHTRAFPESKPIVEIENAVRTAGERTVLVGLFTSDTDRADLLDKSLGWSISPVPLSMKELNQYDAVLRTLFPAQNAWVRYFLLRYNATTWNEADGIIIGRPDLKTDLKKFSAVP